MSEAHEIVEAAFGMIAQNIEKENDHGKKIIEEGKLVQGESFHG